MIILLKIITAIVIVIVILIVFVIVIVIVIVVILIILMPKGTTLGRRLHKLRRREVRHSEPLLNPSQAVELELLFMS